MAKRLSKWDDPAALEAVRAKTNLGEEEFGKIAKLARASHLTFAQFEKSFEMSREGMEYMAQKAAVGMMMSLCFINRLIKATIPDLCERWVRFAEVAEVKMNYPVTPEFLAPFKGLVLNPKDSSWGWDDDLFEASLTSARERWAGMMKQRADHMRENYQ